MLDLPAAEGRYEAPLPSSQPVGTQPRLLRYRVSDTVPSARPSTRVTTGRSASAAR